MQIVWLRWLRRGRGLACWWTMFDHGQNESASHGQESEGVHWGRRVREVAGEDGDGEGEDFRGTNGRRGRDEETSRGEADAAELQSGSDGAPGSGFEVYPRDAEEEAAASTLRR